MTKTFQTATLTWSRFLISLVPILIGMYVGTNAMPGDWLGLLIGGTLGLIIQFGAPVFLSLLKKPEGAFFKTMVIAIVASYVLSYAVMGLGFLLGQPTAENAAAQHFVSLDLWGRVTFFSRLAVSLVGEELITACFLFPILWWALKHYQVKTAWWLAMVVSSLAFGMMHYNAYDWNLYQMLITVGLTRIPFDWAWYKTNSLWTGVVGHIIFDLLAFLVGAMTV